MIYYLMTREELDFALEEEEYWPDHFDDTGYIACVSEEGISTLGRHHEKNEELILLTIDAQKLESAVIYEDLKGDHMMNPHIYGFLNMDAVISTERFDPSRVKVPN